MPNRLFFSIGLLLILLGSLIGWHMSSPLPAGSMLAPPTPAVDDLPISLLLAIDRSASMADDDKIIGGRAAPRAVFAQLDPADEVRILAFHHQQQWMTPVTADRAEMLAVFERIRPEGGTALYDAIIAGVDALDDRASRRVLLVLTDGQDCHEPGACPAIYGSRADRAQAIAYAQRAGIPVHMIGIGAVGSDGIDEATLQQIAADTGGSYTHAPLATDLRHLSQAMRQATQLPPITWRDQVSAMLGRTRDLALAILCLGAGLLLLRTQPRRAASQVVVPPPGLADPWATQPLIGAPCSECGNGALAGSRYCSACGAPIESVARYLPR
mgnify:FL=1